MSQEKPLVSLGLPVYNGARYLREALQALLSQDYQNIELIISDNASTDNSGEICLEVAARDGRVRYCRNETNIGAIKNFNSVFNLSRGKYFMWVAHDDWWHPTIVRKCVDVLEKNPEAVICSTAYGMLDVEGREFKRGGMHVVEASSTDRAARIKQLLTNPSPQFAIYGLIRADALRRAGLMYSVWGCDIVLLTKLCLAGPILAIREKLFSYRVYPRKSFRSIAITLDPTSAEKSTLSLWWDLWKSVLRAIDEYEIGAAEKRRVKKAAALSLSRQWSAWFRLSVADRARFKYLVPALECRERGESGRAALLALRALFSAPLFIFDTGIWLLVAEGVIGRRRVDSARKFFRRYFPRRMET
jgi:glycosyltransferase involved in cell wall biosynthesis